MDNKILIAIVAVAIVVVAAISLVFVSESNVPSDSVRYMGNGGVTENGQYQYDSIGSTVQGCYFIRDGYEFVIWNDKSDGSGVNYAVGSTVPLKTTLYAIWAVPNSLGTVNLNTDVFNLYVGTKGSSSLISIDSTYEDLAPKDAILILKAKNGSNVSIDDSKRVIIHSGEKTYIVVLSILAQGLSLGNPTTLGTTHPAVYYDINQRVEGQQAFLQIEFSMSSSI